MVQTPKEWSAFSNLLDEIGLLRDSFPSFSLSSIPRSCNAKINYLTRYSKNLFSEILFVNTFSILSYQSCSDFLINV